MSSKNQHFDSRMLMYQSMVNMPLQYAQLSLYDDLEDIGAQKYVCTALTNAGSMLLSTKAAKDIYTWLYGQQQAAPDTSYMVSPFTEYLYDHTKNNLKSVHPSLRQNVRDSAKSFLEESPKYSLTYSNTIVATYVCSAILGIAVAKNKLKMSPIAAVLYGLTQPTSIILKDMN